MTSLVGWDSGLEPSASIFQIGRDLQYVSIAFLALPRLCALQISAGDRFQSLAASLWKLDSDFFSLQESLKILFDWVLRT